MLPHSENTSNTTVFSVQGSFIFAETLNRNCFTPSEELKDLAAYLRERGAAILANGLQMELRKGRYENPVLAIGDFQVTTSPGNSNTPFTLTLGIEGVKVTLVKGGNYYEVLSNLNRIVEANLERF
jgi:hypothetical protein